MPRKPELVGQRFGSLTVIGELPERDRRGNVRWLCECECGKEKIATSGDLHVGKAFHCGCSGANTLKNKGMIGKKFHRLLVVEKASPDGDQTCWKCKCDCGKTVTIRSGNLKNGNSQSCGCWRSIANTTHGKSDAPEYGTWSGIKGRCNNPHNSSYRYYGGRGIKICDEWNSSFEEFLKDVGPRPSPEYSLDRINPDGNYEPGNVRWATPVEQLENRKARGITMDYYQHQTARSAIYPNELPQDGIVYCTLGLSSEASEVCGKVKKAIRDNGYEFTAEVRRQIIDEMGDTFWYLSQLASELGIKLGTVAQLNLKKLASRKRRGTLKGSGDNR